MDVIWNPNELCHYGTKGQKWGVRHYQLDDGTWTELGNRRRRIGDGRRGGHGDITSHKGRSSKVERVSSGHNKQTAFEQNKRSFSGTNNRSVSNDEAAKRAHRKEVAKKVAIGVAAVAGIAAVGYLAYGYGSAIAKVTTDVNSEEFFDLYGLNKIESVKQNVIEKEVVDSWGEKFVIPENPKAINYDILKYSGNDFESTINTDATVINHGGTLGHLLLNRDNNCAYCSLAYDLRRRGYDVVANETIDVRNSFGMVTRHGGLTKTDISEIYEGLRGDNFKSLDGDDLLISKKTVKNALDTLSAEGEGARGIIAVGWSDFSGHALNYEVHDGKTYIIDSQIGKVYSSLEDIQKYFSNCVEISSLRTDNLTIRSGKATMPYVANRRESTLDKEHMNRNIKSFLVKSTAQVGAIASIAYVRKYRKEHPNTKKTDAEIKKMYEKEKKS